MNRTLLTRTVYRLSATFLPISSYFCSSLEIKRIVSFSLVASRKKKTKTTKITKVAPIDLRNEKRERNYESDLILLIVATIHILVLFWRRKKFIQNVFRKLTSITLS